MNMWEIFKDDNDYNEKSIIGFRLVHNYGYFCREIDVVTGIMGKDLVINDVVYNSFLFTTLGSFGINEILKKF